MFQIFYHLFPLLGCLHHRTVISSIRGLFISQTSLVFIEFSRFTNDQETLALSQFEIQIHFSPKLIIKPKIINKETNCLRIVFFFWVQLDVECGSRLESHQSATNRVGHAAFSQLHIINWSLLYFIAVVGVIVVAGGGGGGKLLIEHKLMRF